MTTTPSSFSRYINDRNPWINGLALAYVVGGYGVAVVGLGASAWILNLLGVLLLVHTLLWAAYFIHELIHGNIWRQSAANEAWGQIMLFLTGSCYCRYKAIARNHLAHHKNRADFSPFSVAEFLKGLPQPLRALVIALEWAYFPALDFILRGLAILSPFLGQKRRDERWRSGILLVVRLGLFVALAFYSLKAVLLYFLSYLIFLNILRFLDCFQHTYNVFQFGQAIPNYSLEYEEANTFSNVVSLKWPWLNLLFLNFSYHNAHHRVMRCPWYRLPALDAELYPPTYRQYMPLSQLLANYHRYRIRRLFDGQGEVIDTETGIDISQFRGGVGVSFLVLRDTLDWFAQPELA